MGKFLLQKRKRTRLKLNIVCISLTVLLLALSSTIVLFQSTNAHKDTFDEPSYHISNGPIHIANTTLPVPIFVLSLPKSGTTSTWRYFGCGGVPGFHHFGKITNNESQPAGLRIADCMSANQLRNRPLLEGCGDAYLWSDAGIPKKDLCFYPSMDALQDIVKYYPYSTIIMVNRNPHDWYESISKWTAPGKGPLTQRWRKNCPKFPNYENEDEAGWTSFYKEHSAMIRNFAKKHTTLTYVEVELEASETGTILEQRTGISRSCWLDCLPTSRKCRDVNVTKL